MRLPTSDPARRPHGLPRWHGGRTARGGVHRRDEGGPPVSRLVFGGFMEPATTGVWAEMLADRKFFAEITSKPPTPSRPAGSAGEDRSDDGCPSVPTSS